MSIPSNKRPMLPKAFEKKTISETTRFSPMMTKDMSPRDAEYSHGIQDEDDIFAAEKIHESFRVHSLPYQEDWIVTEDENHVSADPI